ncbi:DNA cytosine methyltransferase [Sediminibacterium sp.]|uniref:DNA cytosine methyltransferase n=1 Tax=Sediminibacterium sp. TaxID=1917865 RepID=UPI003F72A355
MTTRQKTRKPIKIKQTLPIVSGVDLFCGVGGLTHGLIKAGIKVRAGIDLDTSCKYAYEVNNKAKFIGADITEITGKQIKEYWQDGEVKILVGCAPCQPFSTHANKVKDKEQGDKWNLLNEFIRLVKETTPVIISMENVTNLSNKQVFKDFVAKLERLKYKVKYKNVYCPDYGIPQKRRRLVLLASQLGEIDFIPPTHKKEKYKTVRDAIGHLEPIECGEISENDKLHFTTKLTEINLRRIKASVPNGTWEDWDKELILECHKKDSGKTYKAVYGRMSWNEPAPTITTQFYNYGTGRFGHPEQDRALTIREGSILQSFPPKYKFVDKKHDVRLTRIGTHIGNAVPVNLGFAIGKSILKHLTKTYNG